MISFVDADRRPVEYLGYTTITDGCRYVFAHSLAGSSLSVRLGAPCESYVTATSHDVTLPAEIPQTDPRIRALCESDQYQFTHRPAVSEDAMAAQPDAYLTSGTPIEVNPPKTLLEAVDTTERLGYEWRRRVSRYRAPTRCSIDESLSPMPAHSHVQYSGLITIGPAYGRELRERVDSIGNSPAVVAFRRPLLE